MNTFLVTQESVMADGPVGLSRLKRLRWTVPDPDSLLMVCSWNSAPCHSLWRRSSLALAFHAALYKWWITFLEVESVYNQYQTLTPLRFSAFLLSWTPSRRDAQIHTGKGRSQFYQRFALIEETEKRYWRVRYCTTKINIPTFYFNPAICVTSRASIHVRQRFKTRWTNPQISVSTQCVCT